VTGNAGSGKSTLAKQLGLLLELPTYSLDRIVWQPGWKKTPVEEKNRKIQELTERESWVIDGVSSAAQSCADTVIFLDVPRRISYWRVAKRNGRYLFHSRPELPPHCPEAHILPALCRIIWNFPSKIRPGILERMEQSKETQRHFHLKTTNDFTLLFTSLKNE
jgi:adenylate kinase family enzyme